MKKIKTYFLSILIFLSASFLCAADRTLIIDDLKSGKWLNQDNMNVQFGEKQNQKFAFVLSYTDCKTLCPMISNDLKKIAKQFSDLKIIIIDIKPESSKIDDLKKYLQKHKLSEKQFQFIKSNTEETDRIVKKMNLFYTKEADLEHFDHSTSIVFFDKASNKLGYLELNNGIDKKSFKRIDEILKNVK